VAPRVVGSNPIAHPKPFNSLRSAERINFAHSLHSVRKPLPPIIQDKIDKFQKNAPSVGKTPAQIRAMCSKIADFRHLQ
jgi:hypothetical protein